MLQKICKVICLQIVLAAAVITAYGQPQPFRDTSVQQGPLLSGSGKTLAAREGNSLAISANGNLVVSGAPGDEDSSGSIFTYVRNGTQWSQSGAKLVLNKMGKVGFGSAIALSSDGNTLAAGAPLYGNREGAIFIFTRKNNTWEYSYGIGSGFFTGGEMLGTSVSISADGKTIASGAPYANYLQGGIWVYTRIQENLWVQQGNGLRMSDPSSGNPCLGSSVAISGDGTTIMAGSPGSPYHGRVCVFRLNGGKWTQQGRSIQPDNALGYSWFGNAVSLTTDGNGSAIGAPFDLNIQSGGAVWPFTHADTGWVQGGKMIDLETMQKYAQTGTSVSISANGGVIIIGVPIAKGNWNGGAKIARWWRESFTFEHQRIPAGTTPVNAMGTAVAVSADGTTFVIGGPYNNNYQGAIAIYVNVPYTGRP